MKTVNLPLHEVFQKAWAYIALFFQNKKKINSNDPGRCRDKEYISAIIEIPNAHEWKYNNRDKTPDTKLRLAERYYERDAWKITCVFR